jgi:hypothetical protein
VTLRRTGAVAIGAGVVGLVALAFLFAFFALEAPHLRPGEADRHPPLLGTINDILFVPEAILLGGVMLGLHGWLPGDRRLRSAALGLGLAGCLVGALIQVLYVPRVIGSAVAGPLLSLDIAVIGAWQLTAALLGLRSRCFGRALGWLGVVAGMGCLSIGLGVVLSGGDPSDPAALSRPPVIAAFTFGLLGYGLLLPVWQVWLGARLLRAPRPSAAPLPG